MRCLEESRKVIIVGIPGVGKTTLVTQVVEILNEKHKSVSVLSFGTVMLDEAKKAGVTDRDELRKISMNKQEELQKNAAEVIASKNDDVVIIDTHAFISTPSGFYPGLPDHVLKIIRPSNFILISARPEEIYNRRMKDETRHRDNISIEGVKKEMAVQDAMISACSVLSGSPLKHILNPEGKVEETAQTVVDALGL